MTLFPLVLLQAKVVGVEKNIVENVHYLFPLVLLQAKVVGSYINECFIPYWERVSISSPSSEGGGCLRM